VYNLCWQDFLPFILFNVRMSLIDIFTPIGKSEITLNALTSGATIVHGAVLCIRKKYSQANYFHRH